MVQERAVDEALSGYLSIACWWWMETKCGREGGPLEYRSFMHVTNCFRYKAWRRGDGVTHMAEKWMTDDNDQA